MLAIRLARAGAKKKPAYRVVVMEKSRARDSKSVEIVGHYNPTKRPIVLDLKQERIEYWISQGAQPSVTVKRLLSYQGETVSDTPRQPTATERAAEGPAPEAQPAEDAAAAAETQAEGGQEQAAESAAGEAQPEAQAEGAAPEEQSGQAEAGSEQEAEKVQDETKAAGPEGQGPASQEESQQDAPADAAGSEEKEAEAKE